MTKHTLYGAKLNTTMIGGITGQAIGLGPELMGEASSGQVNPSIVSLVAVKPLINLTCKSLSDFFAEVGQLGEGIQVATPANVLTLYGYKHAAGGTRAGTLSHRAFIINSGIWVPRRLTAAHRADAQITSDVIVTWDGSNDPVVITDLQTVPALSGEDERFTIGPVMIGGVELTSVRQVEIDFGINAPSEGADSDLYDRIASVETATPVITLRGIDIEWFKAAGIPITGKAGTHANTTIYLRKKAVAGTFVADGTAEHVSITACGLCVVDDAFNAGLTGPGETSLRMQCYHDGTNLPLVIDEAAAIA